MARRLLRVLPIVAIVALWATRADAHATFVNPPATVAPDSDVPLTMNVPNEKGSAAHNVGVEIGLPTGWRGVSCATRATWTSAVSSNGGRSVITFTKDAGAAPAQDETFRFVVHSGNDGGTFPVPTVQNYSNGEAVRWIEAAGSGFPAPQLTVAGTAAPATTPAPEPATTPATQPPTTPAPTAPPATEAPTTLAPTTTEVATTIAGTTTAPSATTTSLPATTAVSLTTTSAAPTTTSVVATAPVTTKKSSGSGTVVGVIVVLGVIAAAAAVVFLRRRSATTP